VYAVHVNACEAEDLRVNDGLDRAIEHGQEPERNVSRARRDRESEFRRMRVCGSDVRETASASSMTAPNLGGGDSPASVRSAALGDTIAPASSRWYLVYYRDPVVLGGCPSVDTFNATQTGRIDWSM